MTATTIVAGLGRCGTSLVMQMLHRGGMPCAGDWPSFEVREVAAKVKPEFIAANAGRAVKVLDPQRVGLPGDVRVIWLDRDHREQAKSHAKFMRLLTGHVYDRAGRRALEGQFVRDTRAAMDLIGSRPVMRLRFEDVLRFPLIYAQLMGQFVRREDFDAEAAARAVVRRGPACLPGMDMETTLIALQHGQEIAHG